MHLQPALLLVMLRLLNFCSILDVRPFAAGLVLGDVIFEDVTQES